MSYGAFLYKFSVNAKRVFLIDGFGAFLSAVFLFAILKTFNEYVGMPPKILTLLSIIAVVFSIYSFSCFFLVNNNWRPFLLVISIANLLYCFLTVGLVIYAYPRLTISGAIYFLLEIIVVSGLALFEIKVLAAGNRKKEEQ